MSDGTAREPENADIAAVEITSSVKIFNSGDRNDSEVVDNDVSQVVLGEDVVTLKRSAANCFLWIGGYTWWQYTVASLWSGQWFIAQFIEPLIGLPQSVLAEKHFANAQLSNCGGLPVIDVMKIDENSLVNCKRKWLHAGFPQIGPLVTLKLFSRGFLGRIELLFRDSLGIGKLLLRDVKSTLSQIVGSVSFVGVGDQEKNTKEFSPELNSVVWVFLFIAGYLIAVWGWWGLYWRDTSGWRELRFGGAFIGGCLISVIGLILGNGIGIL